MQHGLPGQCVMTEKEYADKNKAEPPLPITPAATTLTETYSRRCGSCSTCRQQECQACKSCKFNKESTTKHRRMCIMKVRSAGPFPLVSQRHHFLTIHRYLSLLDV